MKPAITHKNAPCDDALLVNVQEAGTSPDAIFSVTVGRGPHPSKKNDPRVRVLYHREAMTSQEFARLADDFAIVARNHMSMSMALVHHAGRLQRKASKIKRGPTDAQLEARASEFLPSIDDAASNRIADLIAQRKV